LFHKNKKVHTVHWKNSFETKCKLQSLARIVTNLKFKWAGN